jgi:HAD superfamily hydrolase (TIGR01509 family)
VAAVVFDLDGVLLESEQVWAAAKRELTERTGGRWTTAAEHEMLGMSSIEWSEYMREQLAVPLPARQISSAVAELVAARYRAELPLIDGADTAVRSVAALWPLGLASSSNRDTIELVLELTGWRGLFSAWVSSEQVARGKPAPDVYLEALRRLAAPADRCVAVEDSDAGVRSANAAGLAVIAIPNRAFPPSSDTLALASLQLSSIAQLDQRAVAEALDSARRARVTR